MVTTSPVAGQGDLLFGRSLALFGEAEQVARWFVEQTKAGPGCRLSPVRRAAVFLTVACWVASCSGAGQVAPSVPPASGAVALETLPESTTFTSLTGVSIDSVTGTDAGTVVVHPVEELPVYNEYGGRPIARLPAQQVGSPTWLPVLAARGEWVRVLLPSRPNGSTGWLNTAGGKVDRARNSYRVDVDRDGYSLRVVNNGTAEASWKVGIGKEKYPTPVGNFFILASVRETVNKYSPLVLPLSAHSESHETFAGGPGTVAIHTWPTDDHLGKQDSDGCIRVSKDALDRLVKLPLGTLVSVR
ncbi:L,D-transpeptidase [Amycolatopsis sp. H20-H5]|uniref:L,D-transpeptidase n=1 Tax=Amycolatopsis sp. H20-H5 TaxID=3046309 RepID=UPI002DBAB632|nr:L,D-transpeptidase [Amycolatopsis sp. H20-H5]MEC3976581.1 L,D-transpeptidase [Amycolatopsis sp. H20-H5]